MLVLKYCKKGFISLTKLHKKYTFEISVTFYLYHNLYAYFW
jgi:hypothetical protein